MPRVKKGTQEPKDGTWKFPGILYFLILTGLAAFVGSLANGLFVSAGPLRGGGGEIMPGVKYRTQVPKESLKFPVISAVLM